MRAWRARDRFEDGSSLSTWLYHIATNVCFDALRRRRRHAVAVDLGPGRRTPPHASRRRGTVPPNSPNGATTSASPLSRSDISRQPSVSP